MSTKPFAIYNVDIKYKQQHISHFSEISTNPPFLFTQHQNHPFVVLVFYLSMKLLNNCQLSHFHFTRFIKKVVCVCFTAAMVVINVIMAIRVIIMVILVMVAQTKSTRCVSAGKVQTSSVVRGSAVFPWVGRGIMSIADISRGFTVCT